MVKMELNDENMDQNFESKLTESELIKKEYLTVENIKLKQNDSFISAREILEIIKLEKMQKMFVKNFLSNYEYEFILNIETIRTHIHLMLKKIYSIKKETLKIIKKNVTNSKMIEKTFEELDDFKNEDKFENIIDIENEEIDIVELIKTKIKKLSYFKPFREDIDLMNRLKIISENHENSKDNDIRNTINDFINLINEEYKILTEVVELILKEYRKIIKENKEINGN